MPDAGLAEFHAGIAQLDRDASGINADIAAVLTRYTALKASFVEQQPGRDFDALLTPALRALLASSRASKISRLLGHKRKLAEQWGVSVAQLDADFDGCSSTDFWGTLRKLADTHDYKTALPLLQRQRDARLAGTAGGRTVSRELSWQLGDALRCVKVNGYVGLPFPHRVDAEMPSYSSARHQ